MPGVERKTRIERKEKEKKGSLIRFCLRNDELKKLAPAPTIKILFNNRLIVLIGYKEVALVPVSPGNDTSFCNYMHYNCVI